MTETLVHLDCLQGGDTWLAHRIGKLTASRAAAAMMRNAPRKDGSPGPFSAKRRNLVTALALEAVTGRPAYDKPFQTDAMSRGHELEPQARAVDGLRSGTEWQETGFWAHPTLPVGASYDGISADGTEALEVKCLYPANHLTLLLAVEELGPVWEVIPEEYQWQLVHQLAWMPQLKRVWFVPYCPEFNEPLDLLRIPVERDERVLSEYRGAVEVVLAEVADVEAKIRRLSERGV